MVNQLTTYLEDLKLRSQRNSNEHAFRKSLEILVKHKKLDFTMEPKGHGRNKVDIEAYTEGGLIAFYIETKNLGVNLSDPRLQDQFARYKATFSKLIITNFLDFDFYRDGNLVQSCCLGDLSGLEHQADFERFKIALDNFLIDSIAFTDAQKLAKKLAEKTRQLKQALLLKLTQDDIEFSQNRNSITRQYKLLAYRSEFQKILKDIKNPEFADLYAQSVAYGLFASRFYASKKNNSHFSRRDASDFIPHTNPLLKEFFHSISQDSNGLPLDVNSLIDSIASILDHTSMPDVVSSLNEKDIVIHFYETFLEHYDPALKKKMGVWYTPSEIVDYIVRSVDFLLKSKFDIKDGISSNEKQNMTYQQTRPDGTVENVSGLIHRVNILDPSTGTGTFLSSVVSLIKTKYRYPSLWDEYVRKDLIPRIHAFEIMMPSYVMAHMKLSEIVGTTNTSLPRFNIFLTNALTSETEVKYDLFTSSDLVFTLNQESAGANQVRQKPLMVVLGNPPYNGNSKNQSDFILDLMKDYSVEGVNIGKSLNDDYIKFVRFGQSLIDKHQSGILAYISNSSFIQSRACSKMRQSLLLSFDEIYILNLLGDKDENIFNIKTPVCVSFFVKTNKKVPDALGKVYYNEIRGLKVDKIAYCNSQILNSDFKEIAIMGDEKYFIPQDITLIEDYTKNSFSLDELFIQKSIGILTKADTLVIANSKEQLTSKVEAFLHQGILPPSPSEHLKNLKNIGNISGSYKEIPYRPFDLKHYFDSKITARRMSKIVFHEGYEDNIYLNFTHSCMEESFSHILVTHKTPECKLFKGARATYTAPIFQYDPLPLEPHEKQIKSNINQEIFKKFATTVDAVSDLDILM